MVLSKNITGETMLNLRKHTMAQAYEETVKYIVKNKPFESTKTFFDLNIHLEITRPEDKTISNLLPNKNPMFIKKYEEQILNGAKENNFAYTYYDRLFNYNNKINQIDYIINKLAEDLETRQAVAITLIPEKDFTQIQKNYSKMPCLNEICFNIVNERDLYMTSFFRSNDVYGALYNNMRGLIKLGEYIKEKIEEKTDLDLKFKRYNHEIFNGHIYKTDINTILKKLGEKL